MSNKYKWRKWKPYELESLRAEVPLSYYKRSRERLEAKLRLFPKQAAKLKEIADWLEEIIKKNGNGLPF